MITSKKIESDIATWKMVPNAVEMWMAEPLSYLLISVKKIEFEQASFSAM